MVYGVKWFFFLFCLACFWPRYSATNSLKVVHQWKELKFKFPSCEAEQVARQRKYYVPGNSVPIDVDVFYKNGQSRIFVTIPRFIKSIGMPITLGTVDAQGCISAYPDYSWHDNQGQNCAGITSVFRVAIDKCNRLWVMDTGKIGDDQVCPPQLLAFNLHDDQLIFRHVVNSSAYIATSLFITPVVDIRGQGAGACKNAFVYVADSTGFGLLVVDVANHRSWRVVHRFCYPYPSKGNFTIDGVSLDIMGGVLGMALSPPRGEHRYLYFHALASTTENIVHTSELRDASHIEKPDLPPESVTVFPGERPNQAAVEAIDRDGIIYFGLMEPPSIWCWNTATDFNQHNFHQLAIDRETLQFASGVKVVDNLNGEQELWVLTSSLQRAFTGPLSSNRTNFRIHTGNIPTLLANSPCKKLTKKNTSHHDHYSN